MIINPRVVASRDPGAATVWAMSDEQPGIPDSAAGSTREPSRKERITERVRHALYANVDDISLVLDGVLVIECMTPVGRDLRVVEIGDPMPWQVLGMLRTCEIAAEGVLYDYDYGDDYGDDHDDHDDHDDD